MKELVLYEVFNPFYFNVLTHSLWSFNSFFISMYRENLNSKKVLDSNLRVKIFFKKLAQFAATEFCLKKNYSYEICFYHAAYLF